MAGSHRLDKTNQEPLFSPGVVVEYQAQVSSRIKNINVKSGNYFF